MNTTNQNIARACDSVGEVCTMSAVRAGASEREYPPLPHPDGKIDQGGGWFHPTSLYTAPQMRAYVDADRKERQLSACNFCLAEAAKARAQAVPASEAVAPGSPEASAMIDSVLAEYGWPTNPKNAARAGFVAAQRLAAPTGVESGGAEVKAAADQHAKLREELMAIARLDRPLGWSDRIRIGQAIAALQSVKPQGGAE